MTQASVDYGVEVYDSQTTGMAIVSGWEIWARVTFPSGRKSTKVPIAICYSSEDAEEIAGLLREKYRVEVYPMPKATPGYGDIK